MIYGSSDLADELGVQLGTIHQWRKRHPTFPAPAGYLNRGTMPYWNDLEAVISWRAETVRHYTRPR